MKNSTAEVLTVIDDFIKQNNVNIIYPNPECKQVKKCAIVVLDGVRFRRKDVERRLLSFATQGNYMLRWNAKTGKHLVFQLIESCK